MADDAGPAPGDDPAKLAADLKGDGGAAAVKKQRQRPGFLSRLREMSGRSSEDFEFEKTLRCLSKEEASVHARMMRRAHSSRKTARNIIVLSVVLEVVAVAYAIMTTRSSDLNWQMRAVRVLPMFLLPGLSSVIYTAVVSFARMLDRKDRRTLERLRAERQAKIDELKERTNYYSTQQLIQRYDLDPATKAAAATVLASKLGADSGLKMYIGGESGSINAASGKSNDVELVQSSGLRSRKQPLLSHSTGSATMAQFVEEASNEYGADGQEAAAQSQRVVEHYKGPGTTDGGWIARIAALLVGEVPTQCYALICGNCHMHNGLARKEDFPYITFYCPHCHALNGSRQSEHESASSSGKATPRTPGEGYNASHDGSSMSSITEAAVVSSLATVQELSPDGNDEQEATAEAG